MRRRLIQSIDRFAKPQGNANVRDGDRNDRINSEKTEDNRCTINARKPSEITSGRLQVQEKRAVTEGREEGREEGERLGIEKGERLGLEKGNLAGRIQLLQEFARRNSE